jgi:photosystem II stability/assembly factor-like uncharacterized protein
MKGVRYGMLAGIFLCVVGILLWHQTRKEAESKGKVIRSSASVSFFKAPDREKIECNQGEKKERKLFHSPQKAAVLEEWAAEMGPPIEVEVEPLLDLEAIEKEGLPKYTRADLAMQQEWLKTRDPATNEVPRERLYQAYLYMQKLLKEEGTSSHKTAGAIPNMTWIERGPTNQGGRTRAIMYDPTDPTKRRVFVGSVSGGIWKTENIYASNPNWEPVNDFLQNLAVTTLAYDPTSPGTFYAGTGEGFFNLDAVRGGGIFKSVDSGKTWQLLPSTNPASNPAFDYVQKIVVTNNGTILAATRSRYCNVGGIYRSTDGGSTWTRVLSGNGLACGASQYTWAADIEVASNGHIYASMGISYSDGVYKSVDNGLTWTLVYNGKPNNERRIEIATAPSNPNVVYLMTERAGGIYRIYRSTDGGASWSVTPGFSSINWQDACTPSGTDFSRGQAWYDLILAVDPNNANHVWAGGVDGFRTLNGGNTWSQMTEWFNCSGLGDVHADHHAYVFAPGSSDTLLMGTDGGIYLVINASSSPTFIEKNTNYRTLQLYSCALHPSAGSNYALGGTQDNGSHQYTVSGLGPTNEVTGGDGGFCHIDQDQPQYQWTSYVYNNYYRSTNGGMTWVQISYGNTGMFINPTDYDNTNNKLFASHTAGNYLVWQNPQTGSTFNAFNAGFTGTVSAVTCDPNTVDRVWFGTDQGYVYRVNNASTTPTVSNRTPPGMGGNGYVSGIEIEKGNPNHLLVTYSNYGVTSIWETTDGGMTWTAVEGNLPDMPVRWALFNPKNPKSALIATELGVWSTTNLNGSATIWGPSNTGLANVRTDMLQIRWSDSVVIAATHGRGLYETKSFTTNRVQFASNTSTFTEMNRDGYLPAPKHCIPYADDSIKVTLKRPAEVKTVIDVTLDPSTTATPFSDFELLTDSIVFNPGEYEKAVIVRIYNDPYEESNEVIVLNLNSRDPATTNVQNGSPIQHMLTLKSDDWPPLMANASQQQVGTAATTSGSVTPFRGQYEDERMQILIRASELTALGIPNNATLTGIAFNVTGKNSTTAFSGFTVKLAHTTLNNLGSLSTFANPTFTTCYSGNLTTSLGWNPIEFNVGTFTWNGTDNLLIEVCYDNPLGQSSASDLVQVTDVDGVTIYTFYQRTNNASGCALSGNLGDGTTYNNTMRPNLILYYRYPAPIQTAINGATAPTLYLGPNETVHYYDQGSGNIIATVINGGFDFGCTKIEIDRTGPDTALFWHAFPTDSVVMDRTLLVTPANNSGSASYTLRLYYTASEIAALSTNTAFYWKDCKVIKSPGPISNISPSNPQPDGPVTVLNGTVGAYVNGDSIIEATFTNGFSGFAVGVPGLPPSSLPITFLSIEGYAKGWKAFIKWSSAQEPSLAYYEIERRALGEDAFAVVEVMSPDFSSDPAVYTYEDEKVVPGRTYFYRVKAVHSDGQIRYSPLVSIWLVETEPQIRVNGSQLSLVLPPNSENAHATLSIYDLTGKQLFTRSFPMKKDQTSEYTVPLESFSKGVYTVVLEVGTERFSRKVVFD